MKYSVEDYGVTVAATRQRVDSQFALLRAAGHHWLPWSMMPTRRLLRAGGYTGKIPRLYFGRGKDPAWVTTYVAAQRGNWPVTFNRVMLNHLARQGQTELMQRFQLPESLMPLFRHHDLMAQQATFQRLLTARVLLEPANLAPHTSHLHAPAARTLKYLLQRNNLTHFGELSVKNAALFLTFFTADESGFAIADGVDNTIPWAELNRAARISTITAQALKLSYAKEASISLPWRLYTAYTLAELEQLLNVNLPTVQHWLVALTLREQLDPALPMVNILDYLGLQLSLIQDMLPQLEFPDLLGLNLSHVRDILS